MSLLPRLQQYRNPIAALHDTLMAAASFQLALYLRLDDALWQVTEEYLWPGTFIFTTICVSVFMAMRLYKGVWRYASLNDLLAITRAVTLSILIFFPLLFMLTRLEGYPRSALVINWMLRIAMLGGPRLLYRMIRDRGLYFDWSGFTSKRVPVLLIGAGDQAELFVRDTVRREDMPFRVVGILELDPQHRAEGRNIHGIRVYGGLEKLEKVITKLTRKDRRPHKIILADDHLDGAQVRKILELAEAQGMSLARLPKLTDLRVEQGQESHPMLTPIAIEDLLGRPQAMLDMQQMKAFIQGRRVLVTGAGGTIGSELVRQIAALHPVELQLLDHSEYALYTIDREMQEDFPLISRQALLADVREASLIDRLCKRHQPEIIFHAAALKHVPLAEANPLEVIRTNVLGTRNVADSARACGARTMVMISTDKAVHPSSLMGATKRLAEYICQSLGDEAKGTDDTAFVTVRFGNVLGSTGSVVPLFRRQLAQGGPLTVTHPEMTRYFMTVREAVALVIQAAAGAQQQETAEGRIYVLDMGEPVRIMELAEQMIRLAGRVPHEDIAIEITGLRPGEKLYEELFYEDEAPVPTKMAGILLASPRRLPYKTVRKQVDALEKAASKGDTGKLLTLMREAVAEYR